MNPSKLDFPLSLPYPVNAARNVARLTSTTSHVLVSDLELFPSARLADNFVSLVADRGNVYSGEKLVFVVPTFEIEEGEEFPANKQRLLELYR